MSNSPFSDAFNFQFGQGTQLYIGLSFTQPTPDGFNITEPTWSNYSRIFTDVGTTDWNSVSAPLYINNVVLSFPEINLSPNIYNTFLYFIVFDAFGNFVTGGSINPSATVTENATLFFLPGNFILSTSLTTYLPNTANGNAFPSISYPPFSPTYEPAILGEPILYLRNMRS